MLSLQGDLDERVPSDWEKYCLEEYGLLIAEEGGNDDGLVLFVFEFNQG